MESNIMNVAFGSLRTKTTKAMYRLDMEQYLKFTDIELPTSYRVDFGLSETGDTISMIGTEDGVLIPDNLLINPGTLHAWVWLDTGTYGGKTCYHAIIPIKVRGNITDIEPTPSQQTTIDTLIAAMNDAVDDAEASATAAEGYASNAEASADRAEQAAQSIDGKVERAEAAAQAAEAAATRAEDAEDAASLFASNAAESAEAAHLSEVSAEGSASTATTKAAEAEQSAAQAAASAASIEGDVAEAEQAAQQATQAANAAEQSEANARASALSASGSEVNASMKAAEASAFATTASGKAKEAANSATAAQNAQTGAEAAQAASEAAQQAAEEAAQEAQTILVDKAPVITDTASGAIATFPDGAENLPLKKLVAQIEPVQDLHGQDAPYPPGGGANKLNPSAVFDNTSYYTVNGDESVTVTNTDGRGWASITPVLSLPAGTYTIAKTPTTGTSDIRLSTESFATGHVFTSQATFTLSEAGTVKIKMAYSGVTYPQTYKVQIVSGTSVTAWSPYENLCPISGWTGMNGKRTGVNLFDKANGAKNLYVGAGDKTGTGGTLLCFLAKKGCQYTINMTGGNRTNLYYYDASSLDEIVSGITLTTVTLSAAKPYTFIANRDAVYCYYADTYYQQSVADSCQVVVGASTTDYEAYSGESLSVSWQDTAGTVYGGTLAIDEDGSCKLTATHAIVDLDTLTWQNASPSSFERCYSSGVASVIKRPATNNEVMVAWAEQFKVVSRNLVTSESAGISCEYNTGCLFVQGTIAPQGKLVYPLANPITYTLPSVTMLSTFLGTNNIWVDTGYTTVEYRADTKLYLEKLTAPTEDDLIADHAIASGTFFMIGNTLYKALTAIANGATITPGTNAQQLSLADALNLLNT